MDETEDLADYGEAFAEYAQDDYEPIPEPLTFFDDSEDDLGPDPFDTDVDLDEEDFEPDEDD